jgi:HSP20 family protein
MCQLNGGKERTMSLTLRTTPLPDLFRLLEGGWPFVTLGDRHSVRIEEYLDDGSYVLRAELPGMDPEKDIQISVEGNDLSITAERTVEERDKTHSEFAYGSFVRVVRLPVGAAVDKVSARYDAGILEVIVPLTEEHGTRRIPVEVQKKKA